MSAQFPFGQSRLKGVKFQSFATLGATESNSNVHAAQFVLDLLLGGGGGGGGMPAAGGSGWKRQQCTCGLKQQQCEVWRNKKRH